MTVDTKAGSAWADIKPHAERWAVDPTMTLPDVARLSGRAISTVNLQVARNGIKRSDDVIYKARSIRALSVCRSQPAVRWPYRKPTAWVEPAPRYASVWHYAAGMQFVGRKACEVRT